VLLQIGDAANIELVRQLVQAHACWRLKGLAVDLVIWNEDRTLFQSVARAIITDSRGSLAEQIGGRPANRLPARFTPIRVHGAPAPAPAPPPRDDLVFFNGLGGFTPDGHEYIVTTRPGSVTPAPWVNVLANPGFGAVISESGSAYSWAENAHEFRLTPWNNDSVTSVGRPPRTQSPRSTRTPAPCSPRTRTTPSSPGAPPSSTSMTRVAACRATARSSSAATARSDSRPR
jgi:cellobiose phosphorylase